MKISRYTFAFAIFFSFLGTVSSATLPDDFPQRPVRWVLGFAPGGSPDTVSRIITPPLTALMRQTMVLDNRPGSNGIMAANIVAKSNPDAYTLLITSAAFAINPSISKKLPFDSIRSFEPITNLSFSEALILAISPTVPASNLQEFIELAKRPGAHFAYGSSGIGNVTHLSGALFASRTGTTLTHIPYKGGGPMSMALIGGEIQLTLSNPGTLIGQIRNGKIRALAYNAPSRSPLLPQVPTLIESGITGMEIDSSWYGVFAPAHTPKNRIDQLQAQIRQVIFTPSVQKSLAAVNMEPVGNTPAEFKKFVIQSINRFAQLVKLAGIQPE